MDFSWSFEYLFIIGQYLNNYLDFIKYVFNN